MASTHLWLFCSLVLIGSVASDNVNNSTNARQKRLFSIFNVVTFKNDPCTTTGTGNLGGTCMTSSECASKSGSASGNCAAGFGVCCLFIVSEECGSTITINQNCTYIRNNGNPTPDMTAGQTCTFDFKRICDNLCQIRLDFRTLSTLVSATGTCGTAEDAVTVSSPFSSSANAFPPTVCGSLTGQHKSATQTPDPFLLSAPDAIAESTCDPLSHITVMTPTAAMACGGVLGKDGDTGPATVTTTSGSFEVGVRSLTAGTAGITGFNLDFEQVACA
ncbi:hypothetical protein TCAL_12714 [Tigriopus californicus]|uniref:CUB domain-containing protein n=1 Tax=Tigriopus californicus TaxID=6832 RepID=A0A553N9Q2_TIGCA|nr:hypothetical protein TCAL_12714 [Tigriopus californicus]